MSSPNVLSPRTKGGRHEARPAPIRLKGLGTPIVSDPDMDAETVRVEFRPEDS